MLHDLQRMDCLTNTLRHQHWPSLTSMARTYELRIVYLYGSLSGSSEILATCPALLASQDGRSEAAERPMREFSKLRRTRMM